MKLTYLHYIFLFFSLTINSQNNIGIKVGDKFPQFNLKTVDGKHISSKDIKGKVTFFNLWFIHCKPCIDEIPELNKLKRALGDEVNFISATYENKEAVKKFLVKHKFDFDYIATDASHFLKYKLKNVSFPKNIFIDKNGIVRYIKKGLPITLRTTPSNLKIKEQEDFKYFKRYLKRLLKKNDPVYTF